MFDRNADFDSDSGKPELVAVVMAEPYRCA